MTGPVWDGQTINPDALRAYGYNDQITYGGFTLPRFLYYMLAGINQLGTNVNSAAQGYTATSTTSATISAGAKALTVQTSKAFVAGQIISVFSAADPNRFMVGTITSYNTSTGALAFTVDAGDFNGSGTATDWSIQLAGRTGLTGTLWYSGSGTPSNALGKDSDFYLNTANGDVWTKSGGTWSNVGNIRGPQGIQGIPGPAGSGALWSGAAGGTANALTLTPSTPIVSYADGTVLRFRATAQNTGAATINVSGLGVVPILRPDGTALLGGDIQNGQFYVIAYDVANTAFRLSGGGSGGSGEVDYRAETGTTITVGSFKQLFVAEEYFIEDGGTVSVDANGIFAVI